MGGLVAKAEGKLKASNNAEARTRTMQKSYEAYADDLDEDRAPQIEAQPLFIPEGDGAAGEAALQPLRVGVETNNKAHPTRMKWS